MKVLVFGTFDGVHKGHRAMLNQAKSLGSYLVVAVSPDNIVKQIKGKMPHRTGAKRIEAIKTERLADEVILSDQEINSWHILKKIKPNIIALGYDQTDLLTSLENYLDQNYPDIETDTGWQANPKKPKLIEMPYFE